MTRILFICHGNICRSPMAEYIFKQMAEEAGLDVYVESAATSREEIGNDIYSPAKKKLSAKGVPFEHRAARQITWRDYDAFDIIIGMDDANVRNIRRICGGSIEAGDPDGKVFKMMDFAGVDKSVADPWYTHDYETTYLDILEGCKGLIEYIRSM